MQLAVHDVNDKLVDSVKGKEGVASMRLMCDEYVEQSLTMLPLV
jgi:hypothetical protein